jgi:hypothetical protein
MAWPGTTGGNSDPEKMTIATQAPDLNYVAASPTAGAEAVHGGPDNHLQSATLEVTKAGSKATYQFACIPNPGEICLAIDYHCRVNDSSCLPDPAK